MAKVKDLKGKRFGILYVIAFKGCDKYGHATWECICDCGSKKIISSSSLKRGCKSCGCIRRDKLIERTTTHGNSKSRLYKTWKNMKTRCLNSNNYKYKSYGARGICICDEWANSFESFLTWALSNGYNDKLTIERIDVNGNYEPRNCKWIEPEKQALNRTNTKKVIFEGKEMSVKELSLISGVSESAIYKHLRRGMIDFTDYIKTGLPFYTVR